MAEIIDSGRTGFLVDSTEEAVRAVFEIEDLSRDLCASEARRRFDCRIMAAAYERVYTGLASCYVANSGYTSLP